MTVVSTKERLARMEANLEQLVFDTRQLHGELRAALESHAQGVERQDGRVRALEKSAEETRTHLRWMKAAWATVQAGLFAWLGLK